MNKEKPKKPFDDQWGQKLPNGGASWAAFNPPRDPEPVAYIAKDEWPATKPRSDRVFAKSCAPGNWCSTKPGTDTVPASDFGKVMLAAPMLVPSSIEAIGLTAGFDAVLGRIAGSGILQKGFRWALRGSPAGVFIAGMLPAEMGDGTLYNDDDLRQMSHAPTRVRFQFRRDSEGVMQVYGIHTGPTGDDSVRTVQVKWNANKTVLEADLNGITILWTPRGPLAIPSMSHPEQRSGDPIILVHPIQENKDSAIEVYPTGEDVETHDCILVFPANTGLSSLYLVFTRPIGGDHSYHPPPKGLTAFPDAKIAPRKTPIKGGGGLRKRWKTSDGIIYEWDSQHGTVEKYNKRGKHLGEFNPNTGEQTKDTDNAREVEP
ncbi:colicin E3/pyocin S6 family cytotoxin [Pseudomonas sp. NUPR-001]|uniref:colicin E3/pyocin S6 family cytotoxin n=1 Tax=Pseudomonas sp. NUPR-001 TaxID=3416058 RepID=UPI003A9B65C5